MKLKKKTETEILNIYDTWLQSYLNGDVKTYDSFLDDDYHFIGSAAKEEFLNRQDTTQFFADTGEQFAGKTEIRNESKTIEQFGELIFITHVLDAWFLNDGEWNFYSRFRFTSVLRKNKDAWRFIYQHFSIPDPKTAEGETIGYDKINEENQELREAIQRRTYELEEKNRELEIEAALERVRSRSMAMTKSEQLSDVILKIHHKFKELDISMESRIAIVVVFDSDGKDFNQYIASNDVGNIYISTPYFEHPILDDFYFAKESGVEFFSKSYTEDEKNSYFKTFFETSIHDEIEGIEEQAKWVFEQKFYTHSQAFQKNSSIGMADYSGIPLNDNEIDIIKRFSKVFDQAYTRFLDLQKAEAQAREAQIEAALERVRSRSMAMQNSDEIGDVAFVLFQQLKNLGGDLWGTGFGFCENGSDDDEFWFANEKGIMPNLKIPHTKDPVHKQMYHGWKNNLELFSIAKDGNELKDHYKYMLSVPAVQPIFQGMLDSGVSFPKWQKWHAAYFKYGYLLVITTEPYENEAVFKRFANVFEQAYTRFLDLKKAEAQTRAAQINLAVERVRAKALAMHKSEEIMEVVAKLKEEVMGLDIEGVVAATIFLKAENNQIRMWDLSALERTEKGYLAISDITFKLKKKDPHLYIKRVWENPKDYCIVFQDSKDLDRIIEFMYENNQLEVAKEVEEYTKSTQLKELYHATQKLHNGKLCIDMLTSPPEEMETILNKMGAAFDLAYKRFEDIKNAEAQTQEAQIETALEKIRSRTMAMQESNELEEVAVLLYKELIALKVTNFVSCGYVEVNEERQRQLTWITNPGGDSMALFYLPLTGDATFDERYHAWKTKQTVFHQTVAGKERQNHLEYAITTFQSKEAEEMVRSQFPDPTVFYCFNFSHGYLHLVGGSLLSKEEEALLVRFTNVFEQTYARFLDLQKAEAQAREAQIEVALERVRSQSMSMQHSEELSTTTQVFHQQLQMLGIDSEFSYLWLPEEDEKHQVFWATWSQDQINQNNYHTKKVRYPLDKSEPSIAACYTAWESEEPIHVNEVTPEDVEDYFNTWSELLSGVDKFKPQLFQDGLYYIDAYMRYGCFGIMIKRLLNDNEKTILNRFSNEFQRTYTRFLDLQKAEAQAREAQIEAALERIRSRTMGMQSSEELPKVANLLFNEVQGLGIPAWSCGYNILAEDQKSATCCMSSQGTLQTPFQLRLWGEASFEEMGDFIQSDQNMLVQELGGSALEEHYAYMKSFSDLKPTFDEIDRLGLSLPNYQINHLCKFNQGFILFITYEKVPHAHDIFKRFTKVFDQTYTRFLDLKKAEAQARESQIEAALERVRSHSMGMQSTDDFGAVTTEMFNQLRMFGEDLFATGIVFCNKHEGHVEQWHSIPGAGMVSPFIVPIDLDYIHQYRYDQWKKGEELFSIEIPSDFIEQHFQDIFNLPSAQIALKDLESRNAPMPEAPPWEIDYGASFEHGYVLISSLKPLENTDILLRFTKVFEQAYTRFLDLKRAEAQAREAKIETALEKVRSRSLSMQQPNELNEVVQLIAEKLQELDVILDLGGVVICTYFPDSKDVLHWIATPDSESSGKFLLPYFDHIILKEAWASKNKGDQWFSKAYSIEEKNSFFKHAFKHSDYKHFPEEAKEDILNRKHHTLSFAWSKHSALLIPSYSGLMPTDDEKEILIRFGKVFEHAYIRFMDLQEKEVQAKALFQEKKRLEETLSDLQTTQKQLIQSEKMASLGELTAGIAHEIQNPLNFVNNFSEVSKELLEEMQEEIDNGDFEEVKAIMQDVIQNLEKINHHGQRADGIVKGMLQHSRSGSDQKEATDLNVLADEYLRLAYHGLRAKDKSFNAELVTDFDNTIKPVKVMPQDIGRVILNLLTNAFYIVHQKKQTADKAYKPTVIISTKSHKQHIEIKVIDNGNGIPDHIKDKIFQPFFTTKPTGEGTGLGLSLSYDIITKGHGGKLEVNTKTKQGTEFTIQLPS